MSEGLSWQRRTLVGIPTYVLADQHFSEKTTYEDAPRPGFDSSLVKRGNLDY